MIPPIQTQAGQPAGTSSGGKAVSNEEAGGGGQERPLTRNHGPPPAAGGRHGPSGAARGCHQPPPAAGGYHGLPREEGPIQNPGRTIAEFGLRIGAIKLNPEDPFQWASGYRMPIYNDNRMFLFHPEMRRTIAQGLAEMIRVEGVEPEVVAGTATAGIPHGALLADHLELPFIYVRDKPKAHGLKNRIEGLDAESDLGGRRVVVIEDLISTGGSSARAVEAVREAAGECAWCLSIFSYGLEKAAQQFEALEPPCNFASLLSFPLLLEEARSGGFLSDDQIELLVEWRRDPFGWGEKHGFPKVG